jgi:hypothetical protein
VGFVVDKVALGQGFLRVLRFFPVNIISPLLHIHSYIIWEMDKRSFRHPVPYTKSHPIVIITMKKLETFGIDIFTSYKTTRHSSDILTLCTLALPVTLNSSTAAGFQKIEKSFTFTLVYGF